MGRDVRELQIPGTLPGTFRQDLARWGLHPTVELSLVEFAEAVSDYRHISSFADGTASCCPIDLILVDKWDLNAFVRPNEWGRIRFHCGCAPALMDASFALASHPGFWNYVGRVRRSGHPLLTYHQCGNGDPFTVDCAPISNPQIISLADNLFRAAAHFIVCHELAHLKFGHVFIAASDRNKHHKVIEYQADTVAADICTRRDHLDTLKHGHNGEERLRIAIAGALMAFALLAQRGGENQEGYPRMQARCLTMLWMFFSKWHYPQLSLLDSGPWQVLQDANAIKSLFNCDWLAPEAIMEVYTARFLTDKGMTELEDLTKQSNDALETWQAEALRQVDREIRMRATR